MVQRRIPLTVYRPNKAGVRSFAFLASLEAAARAVILSVYPVLLYRTLGDAQPVSEIYFIAGLISLGAAALTPLAAGFIPRRWLYSVGVAVMVISNLSVVMLGSQVVIFTLIGNAVALVVMTVCFNAYVMDFIERTSLGKNESTRLVFSGISWMVGPYLGVVLMDVWPNGPFILATVFCLLLMAFFWYLRLGNGKVITRARSKPKNPLAFVPRFFRQPLLVSGWVFACMRSVGWQVYGIFLPIFCIENGLGEQLGGLMYSCSNALLFLAPLMLRYLVSRSVRFAIMFGFACAGACYAAASAIAWFHDPALAAYVVGFMFASTLFLVLLDVCAGLPFLMSVKPSERTDMAAVYSTFRDVSAVVTPGAARIILAFGPLAAVFAACSGGLLLCWGIAGLLNPRLGKRRKGSTIEAVSAE